MTPPPKLAMEWLAGQIVRYRMVLLAGCVLMTVAAFPLARRIQYDRSVQSLFAKNNPRLTVYNQMVRDFGGDALCLVAYEDPELLSAAGLRRLDDFTHALREVPGVLAADSLSAMPRPRDPALLRNLGRWFFERSTGENASQRHEKLLWRTLVEWYELAAGDLEKLNAEVLASSYVDQFISRDGRVAAVVLALDRQRMSNGTIEATLERLRHMSHHDAPGNAYLVGTTVMINDVYTYLDEDSWVLTWVSSLAMMAVIFIMFRNVVWTILPILVVQVTLLWTKALMVLCDIRLSLVGSMTTALVTVIGIATAIHLVVRFREESVATGEPLEAARRTIARLFMAIFWTCATTAGGFGALAVSDVRPVREYAFIMASASMLVGLASFLLLPGASLLLGGKRSLPGAALGEQGLAHGLRFVVGFVGRHSFTSVAVLASMVLAAMWGCQYVEVETDFTRNFRADSPLLSGYRFVETRFGGAGLVDLVFDAPKSLTPDFLDKVRHCQEELRGVENVTKVTGLTDIFDALRDSGGQMARENTFLSRATAAMGLNGIAAQALNAADRNSSIIDWRGNLLQLQLGMLRALRPKALDAFWNPEQTRMRILVRVNEQQTTKGKREQLAELERITRSHFGTNAEATGLYVLLIYLIDNLIGDQWLSFGVSAACIFLMTACAFRSLRLGLVALIPNIFPFLVVVGAMGWLGFKLNVATAMIGSISMGLVVDFSIHYLNRFSEERRRGADFYRALAITHGSTGKAMVFANLALMLGFSCLVFSNFVPTVQFGILVSVAILGGLVGNLVLLPVLLRVAYWVPRPSAELLNDI